MEVGVYGSGGGLGEGIGREDERGEEEEWKSGGVMDWGVLVAWLWRMGCGRGDLVMEV
ncbi:uncharacterized protein G2W53_000975 [Senna tora]|uniref:Uncharacterized protein n=1 Tax=Senna tora TaxID=362788 RepID=A0A834XGM4_9FABA|nr:uncharacterized protein G2W53_000975 [Senna tora]